MEIAHTSAPAEQGASTQLVVTPHPLTRQNQTSVALLWDNETLLEVIEPHGVNAGWVVCVGGVEVPAHYWSRVRVKHGQVIECRRRVHSDAISGLFKLVAVAALVYFSFGAGGAFAFTLAGFSGLSGAALTFAQMALFQGGMLLINKLLPGKQADTTTRDTPQNVPTYSLTGNGNRTRPWAPMAIVFGEPYVVPDLASQPYTYFSGGDQYLTQIFHGGFNCASVSSIKIGETLISDYTDVQLFSNNLHQAGDNGMPSGNVDTIAGALLDAPTAPGPWVVRTTSVNTISAVVEFEASLFTVNNSSGAYEEAACNLDIQYRAVGSSTWLDRITPTQETYTTLTDVYGNYTASAGRGNTTTYYGLIRQDRTSATVPNGKIYLRHASAKALRTSYTLSLALGQWEIRIRKTTVNSSANNTQNAVSWTQLRSYQQDLASYPGEARLGVIIKASGQLSGSIDQLNWLAKAKPMPYWNGSAWSTATSAANGLSNPGAQILLLARGVYDTNSALVAGLGWADSRIDLESLKRFMVWCAAKGFTHNFVQQENVSLFELMNNIAAVGLGRLDWADGRLGVTFLSDTAPIECVVNMANMKAKTFSVSYPLASRADELEYGFFDVANSNTWQSLRVLAPGVTNPARTARMNNAGVTTEAHAAIMARFQMAANIYMGKSITFDLDMEYLTFGINTVIALSHDLTQWGYGGRVQSVANNAGILTLGLDDSIPAGSASRYIGLRLLGEQQYRIFAVQAFTGTARSVTLSTAWPAGVPVPGTNNQAMDALWIYDFKATPGAKCVVTSIEPAGTESAKITVVPLADEFWPYVLSGSYTPPPNISLLSAKPVASNVQVTETLRKNGLSYIVDLQIRFDLAGPYARAELWGALGTGELKKLADTTTQEFIHTAALKESWYFEVRPFGVLGQGATASASYLVQGLSFPPDSPAQFVAIITSNGVQLRCEPSTSADYDSTIFKLGQTYASATLITRKSSTTHLLGWLSAGTTYFTAKHVDCIGNESTSAATTSISVVAPSAPASLQIQFGTANIEAVWSAPGIAANQQPLERIELSWSSAFTSIIDGKKATTATFGWLAAGVYTLYARYIDVAGNVGAVSSATLQVLSPAQPVMTSVETQINLVTLRWQDAKTSQPIKKYAIWFGEGGTLFANASLYGSAGADSRSDILQYRSSGSKVAYLVAEDVAGNQSTPRQIDLSITMPNDFVLATEYYEDWQSTELTNGTIIGGASGQIILPANDGRTWGQRLSNSGWTTAQQKFDAGYPIVVQPVPASGKHVEQRDVGKVIASAVVRVAPTLQSSVAGYTATIRMRVSNGNTNTSWQAWLTGDSAVISNFRYIEVEYSVVSDGKGFVVLDDLYVKVEIAEVTESAVLALTASASGTVYECTKPFLDLKTVQITVQGSSNIARTFYVIDDATLPAKVYVFAKDSSNNDVGGTVSLFLTGV